MQAILASHVRSALKFVLNPEQLEAVLASTINSSAPNPNLALVARRVFGVAFNQQMRVVTYLAVTALAASLFA